MRKEKELLDDEMKEIDKLDIGLKFMNVHLTIFGNTMSQEGRDTVDFIIKKLTEIKNGELVPREKILSKIGKAICRAVGKEMPLQCSRNCGVIVDGIPECNIRTELNKAIVKSLK